VPQYFPFYAAINDKLCYCARFLFFPFPPKIFFPPKITSAQDRIDFAQASLIRVTGRVCEKNRAK
jgi:hypothetical protein